METYYNRAMAYYREKNYHEAFRTFLEAANRGNLLASSYLDFMHEKGQGTTRDYHKAIDYYALAGNSGIPGARYNLGLMFYEGRPGHLQKDYAIALYWFSQAAESKHDMAENYIGSIYHKGLGTAQNFNTALPWKSAIMATATILYIISVFSIVMTWVLREL